MQMNTFVRDIERLDSLLEELRHKGAHRGDDDFDLAKKLLVLEREAAQLKKEQRHEVHEIKQSVGEVEILAKNLRHQLEQASASNEFKKQEMVASQTDLLQNMTLRIDQQERMMRKMSSDIEGQYSQMRDANRQF